MRMGRFEHLAVRGGHLPAISIRAGAVVEDWQHLRSVANSFSDSSQGPARKYPPIGGAFAHMERISGFTTRSATSIWSSSASRKLERPRWVCDAECEERGM